MNMYQYGRKDVFLMKKYMTPELSEILNLEDVLAVSESDNSDGDGWNDGYDGESSWGGKSRSIDAD